MARFQHEQDSRHMGKTLHTNRFFASAIYGPILSLIGFPRISGFLSKDMVLEEFFFRLQSWVLYLVIVVNVALSYLYAYKLLILILKENLSCNFISLVKYSPVLQGGVRLLGIAGVGFGWVFCRYLWEVPAIPAIPFELKIMFLTINVAGLTCLMLYRDRGLIKGTLFMYRIGYIPARNNFMALGIGTKIFAGYTGIKVGLSYVNSGSAWAGGHIGTRVPPISGILGALICLGLLSVPL